MEGYSAKPPSRFPMLIHNVDWMNEIIQGAKLIDAAWKSGLSMSTAGFAFMLSYEVDD